MHLPPSHDSDFAPPPSGTHLAICHRVIDLGTQKVEWNGQNKTQRKVLITWELPDEKMDDGRPFTISQRYTFSSSERATFRQHLEGWRGKRFVDSDFGPGGFDIKNILGKACLLNIVHAEKGGKTYANIGSVSALPKGMQPPAPINESVYFSLESDRFERPVMEKLSDGLQNIIRLSPEYARLTSGTKQANGSGYETAPDDGRFAPMATSPADFDDAIPFAPEFR